MPPATPEMVIELPVVNPCATAVVMAHGLPVAMDVIPALEELLVRKSRYTLLFNVVVALLGTGTGDIGLRTAGHDRHHIAARSLAVGHVHHARGGHIQSVATDDAARVGCGRGRAIDAGNREGGRIRTVTE